MSFKISLPAFPHRSLSLEDRVVIQTPHVGLSTLKSLSSVNIDWLLGHCVNCIQKCIQSIASRGASDDGWTISIAVSLRSCFILCQSNRKLAVGFPKGLQPSNCRFFTSLPVPGIDFNLWGRL